MLVERHADPFGRHNHRRCDGIGKSGLQFDRQVARCDRRLAPCIAPTAFGDQEAGPQRCEIGILANAWKQRWLGRIGARRVLGRHQVIEHAREEEFGEPVG